MDGWMDRMDGWKDRWIDGLLNEWMDVWTDGSMARWTTSLKIGQIVGKIDYHNIYVTTS